MSIARGVRALVGREWSPATPAWLAVFAALALSLLGLYAIDVATVREPAWSGTDGRTLPLKQGIFVAVGLLAAALVATPHYRAARALAWPLMLVVVALLAFLLIPSVPHWLVRPRNGARAWINLGPVDFQPAELAKIALVLVLADYFRFRSNHRRLLGLVPPAVITLVPVALIILQRDLGTAIVFLPCLLSMLLAAGARLKHLAAVVLAGCLALPATYPVLRPHQQQRIAGLISMIQGSAEGADDINFQSLTAVRMEGAGGAFGTPDAKARALLHYNGLPERHNDMVFAVIVHRFGFVGGVAVLALYLAWFAGAFLTAAACRDPFGRLVVVGCCAIVAAQVFINVGMNLALLPIIGVTLPFLSYGGSSMLSVWIMTGLILSVGLRPPRRLERESFEFGADE